MAVLNEKVVKVIIPFIKKIIDEHEKKVGVLHVEIHRDESCGEEDGSYYDEMVVFKKPLVINDLKIYGYDTDDVIYYWTNIDMQYDELYRKVLSGETNIIYESDIYWRVIDDIVKYLLKNGFSLGVRI